GRRCARAAGRGGGSARRRGGAGGPGGGVPVRRRVVVGAPSVLRVGETFLQGAEHLLEHGHLLRQRLIAEVFGSRDGCFDLVLSAHVHSSPTSPYSRSGRSQSQDTVRVSVPGSGRMVATSAASLACHAATQAARSSSMLSRPPSCRSRSPSSRRRYTCCPLTRARACRQCTSPPVCTLTCGCGRPRARRSAPR